MSEPSLSRKRTTTDWGSSGARRTDRPPIWRGDRVTNRVTGMLATSRSITLMPAALSPAIIARFSMRAERLESREVTTVSPLRNVVPYAIARRVASSGVMSTFASPATPLRPNSDRAPRDSHTIEEFTTAPASTVLNGYTFTPAVMHRVLADEALVAEHDALLEARVSADVARPPDHRAAQPRSFADVHVVVQHDSLEVDVAADTHVRAEHRVLTESGAGFDSHSRGR